MNNEELKSFITQRVPDAQYIDGKQFLECKIPSSQWLALAKDLKADTSTSFDYLFCLTAIDYADHMEVAYHMRSTQLGHEMVVKASIPSRETPTIESVCHIWRTAEFHEREAYDLFGIVFTNHPDLRRLLLTDDWEGYPMRKDYEDPINMIEY